ncbi:hypothetical protein [Pedobacter nanyangensis]|uniref:hypothetical protein n=1 Tax=Pedobacter nanyangensis TaxID=1562389 RepID=UPI000DE4B8C0|nr:hypothetical protein [Pedobacter nanyangensis]
MEIQFEQNRNFNQSHREDPSVTQTTQKDKGKPQGKEGDPQQHLVNSRALDTEEKTLDRRPADVSNGEAGNNDDKASSAVPGIQSDSQNSTRNSSKPLGEDPNVNADRENQEDQEELEKGDRP